MTYFSCSFCFNKFRTKKNLDSHVALCKEYHRIQTEESPQENLPHPKILYKMLKDLIVNQRNLEREVLFLKNKLNIQERKDIILWLNETTNKQLTIHENIKMGFSKWISMFSINQSHLEKVFQGNIIDGIQSVLSEKINDATNERVGEHQTLTAYEGKISSSLPIRAFSQKTNVIYIYDMVKNKDISERSVGELQTSRGWDPQNTIRENIVDSTNPSKPNEHLHRSEADAHAKDNEDVLSREPCSNPLIKLKSKGNMTAWSWRILKNDDLEKVIESIRKKILLEFTKWQIENRELIESSDEMKENEIEYMLKFNCIKITIEKRVEIIKKWLYDTMKENKVLTSIEFKDFTDT